MPCLQVQQPPGMPCAHPYLYLCSSNLKLNSHRGEREIVQSSHLAREEWELFVSIFLLVVCLSLSD